jgi:DNA modification methylase
METFLELEYTHDAPRPPTMIDEFRTPDPLVEHFLDAYTTPGDRVLDVFAGFGTTLRVAERLDRIPVGIEYDAERVAYVDDDLSTTDGVRHGDVLELDASWFDPCELCFTSPPFMEQTDHRNPFENYAGESTYSEYLDDVEDAFERVERVLAPDGRVVVDASNMKHENRVTTLAWDVADRVSNVLHFDGEVVVGWREGTDRDNGPGTFGYGYDHSYCLLFQCVST